MNKAVYSLASPVLRCSLMFQSYPPVENPVKRLETPAVHQTVPIVTPTHQGIMTVMSSFIH